MKTRYNLKKLTNKTIKNRTITNRTKKNRLLDSFQKEITVIFFELLLMIKLFHWNTHSYSTHKATDELYSSFNENMDKFIEVLLGKTGQRIDLYDKKQIRLEYLTSNDKLKQHIESFKSYLVSLDNKPAMKLMSNTDLLNIRDELLGDMNKFLYLLTLK
jgi:DNA-binding ferritin-like protein